MGKGNKQEKLNEDAVEKVFGSDLSSQWKLQLQEAKPTKSNKNRELLEKHLGGFLGRELDFFIKNEIMHLDDIEEVSFVHI